MNLFKPFFIFLKNKNKIKNVFLIVSRCGRTLPCGDACTRHVIVFVCGTCVCVCARVYTCVPVCARVRTCARDSD